MKYDQSIVEKYRQKAITNANQLVPGRTYWSNWRKDSFMFIKLMTTRESYAMLGLESADESINWMLMKLPNDSIKSQSLRDDNIGASYNPWLIFENEQDMKDYVAELAMSK